MNNIHNLSVAGEDLLAEINEYQHGRAVATFEVRNPADGALIANVSDMGSQDARIAIFEAKAAFPAWSGRSALDRSDLLRRWYDLIIENQHALSELLTLEQGKPLAEALNEVLYGARFIEWYAEEAKRAYGETIPSNSPDKRCLTIRQAIGVVGAITPWNFPSAMITRKVSPALAAGCTIVVKPAEDTPLSALALQLLAEKAGIPSGVLNVVTTSRPAEVGEVFTAHPDIRKISFTGSTAVGKKLMRQCADTLKKLSLELGGNSPFIVFDDADIDACIEGAIATKFRNAGQACVATNRIYVQSGIRERFENRLAAAIEGLSIGAGREKGVRIGPMINAAAVDKVMSLVADASAKGARILRGGNLHSCGGQFFEPTLICDATHDMNVSNTEIFGPVAAVYAFETEAEVVSMANDTPYGLAAYLWTRDIGRAFRVSEALEYGMVGVNEVLSSNPATPFGGVKESGIGREGSRHGLDEYLEIKYVALGGIGTLG